MRTVYEEKVLSELLGVSQSTVRSAGRSAGVDDLERVLVHCGGKTVAALTVSGVRKLVRWLSCEKNAPRCSENVREKRLAALLAGAEVREGCLRAEVHGARIVASLPPPGGFPFPAEFELEIVRLSLNPRLVLCRVPSGSVYESPVRLAMQERGIEEGSIRLRVMVNSKVNLIERMLLPVVWVESDLFRCVAKRAPRFNGRW